jgi:hypothetical protein
MTFRLEESERETARAAIAAWVDSVPTGLLDHVADTLDRYGMVRTEHATRWARQEHALLRDLASALALEGERLAAARRYEAVLVPMRRPEEADDDEGR